MVFGLFNKKTEQRTTVSQGIKPVVLLILDGWGIAPESPGNAIRLAKTPNMDSYPLKYPHGELIAAGESVGLPANEAGNSEVGHLTIGAGRVLPQSLKAIDAAIKDGRFFENAVFIKALEQARKNNSKLHLMGLVGTGEVHSSLKHVYALLELCHKQQFKNVWLHLFTDGRDSPPKEAAAVIEQIEVRLRDLGLGKIATISGRYFAMDRDRRWERTEKAYKAVVMGRGKIAESAVEAVRQAYAAGQTDEFIEPTVIVGGANSQEDTGIIEKHTGNSGNESVSALSSKEKGRPAYAQGSGEARPVGTIDDNDSVIFFNFRIDRPRQLTMALTLAEFEDLRGFEFEFDPYKTKYDKRHGGRDVYSGKTFVREKWPKNLFLVTLTEYQKNLPVSAIAFVTSVVNDSMTEVVSKHNLRQLHLAESEKERMVTYYFDGLREERFTGEEVIIIPSPKVPTYDKKPEMSAFSIVSEFKKALSNGGYRFIIVNLANPDMVAHSGNIKAAIKACEFTDQAVGEMVEAVLAGEGTMVITADHGNAEDLLTFPGSGFFFTTQEGKVNTEHSNHPVPIVIIDRKLEDRPVQLSRGSFSDVAPTMLKLLGLPVPKVMTGKNLLEGMGIAVSAPEAAGTRGGVNWPADGGSEFRERRSIGVGPVVNNRKDLGI